MKKLLKKENVYLLGAIFVFALFAYITYCTPLAGDDWGYYLNGMKDSPIAMAIAFYKSWSGRFFSELWGMIIPAHKWLWNIINPLLFTGIYVLVYKLADIKNKFVTSAVLVLVLMLSVEEGVRMETYTWIMGTTYIIPLLFSLLYFCLIDKAFKDEKINKTALYLSNILLFVSCLMMENIAATLVGSTLIIGIYAFFKKKELTKYLIINFVVALVAFMIMRMSPGSTYRTLRDHALWSEMSLFEKVFTAYPNFLDTTFISNRYLIVVLSVVMLGFLIFAKKKMLSIKIVSCLVYGLAVLAMLSYYLKLENNILIDSYSIFSYLFWPIYVITILVDLFLFIDKGYLRDKTIMILVIGGACALVMLYSPIYGARSAIYTIYYLIVLVISIFDSYELPKKFMYYVLVIGMIGFVLLRARSYINKYTMARNAQIERETIVEYYRNNPDVEEVWIPRFPINIIHSIDVEEGDTYHYETFKEYYKLPQAADKIYFYYKESY